MLEWFFFQNVFLVTMLWSAILTASVRTVEFAAGFLETVSASQVIMEETANMINQENEWAYYGVDIF